MENIFRTQIFESVRQYYANQGMASEDPRNKPQDVAPPPSAAEEAKQENQEESKDEDKKAEDPLEDWSGSELKSSDDLIYKL